MTQERLQAICDLEQLEREQGNSKYIEIEMVLGNVQGHVEKARTISNEMCTFLVMKYLVTAIDTEHHRLP